MNFIRPSIPKTKIVFFLLSESNNNNNKITSPIIVEVVLIELERESYIRDSLAGGILLTSIRLLGLYNSFFSYSTTIIIIQIDHCVVKE